MVNKKNNNNNNKSSSYSLAFGRWPQTINGNILPANGHSWEINLPNWKSYGTYGGHNRIILPIIEHQHGPVQTWINWTTINLHSLVLNMLMILLYVELYWYWKNLQRFHFWPEFQHSIQNLACLSVITTPGADFQTWIKIAF